MPNKHIPSQSPHSPMVTAINVGHVHPSFPKEVSALHDMNKALKCMRNKRIVMLGDSSVAEVFHDLALLFSGISSEPLKDTMLAYVMKATKREKGGGRETWRYDLPNDVFVEFHGLHRRNMTLYAPNNVVVRYRFTGHYDPAKNLMGIDTFFDKNFEEELSCLLGVNKDTYDCPRPDILLINRLVTFQFILSPLTEND